MAGFTESGITLEFSTESWFRFEKAEPYKSVSCFCFKEMDACWVDYTDKKFYAIELKDYTRAGSLEAGNVEKRISNIVKKVVDSMQMFLSAKYQNAFGKELERRNKVDLHSDYLEVWFITIVNIDNSSKVDLAGFKDKCVNTLQAYTKVWDHVHITLMTYNQAKLRFPFVK